jgi:hypothetical protein
MSEPAPAPAEPAADPAPADPASSAIAAANELPLHEAMPEKFRVFEGEGDAAQFNLEGSAKKLLDSYSALEKRNGAPESPDDYKVESEALGEDFSFDEFKKDETNQAFLKSMHAAGLNNGQVQKVLEYGMKELIPGLMQGNQSLNQEDSIKHMQTEVWTDQKQYAENMNLANRAYSSLSPDLQDKINKAIGNDPVFLEVMSIFGKEMQEDTSPSETITDDEAVEVEKLMMSEAYRDSKHPEHKKVSQQVAVYFQKKHPQKSA